MTAPGTTLGVYRIERPLGSGGMGKVFLAYDTSLQRQVAVKVMDAPPTAKHRASSCCARRAAPPR